MLDVLSRDQIRAFDKFASEVAHVPSPLLMENAGRGAVDAILRERGRGPHRALVVCGPGNNGGDGFVVARRLLTLGHEARVLLAADPEKLHGDARSNYDAWIGLGQTVERVTDAAAVKITEAFAWCDLLIDALMGTGLERELTGLFADLVAACNACDAYKVALDIPTGLDSNTGKVWGSVMRANLTVTFAHRKLGLYGAKAADMVGKIVTADIGVPASISDEVGISATVTEEADVRALLAARPASTHKGDAGRVLIVGGSTGKTGAALLAAHAALRTGAGLCTIACFEGAKASLESKVVEVMTQAMPTDDPLPAIEHLLAQSDAVVVGPGIGLSSEARRVVDYLVLEHPKVVIADADALTHFTDRAGQIKRAKGPRILTPHPGEMARLLGMNVAAAEADRFRTLKAAVAVTGASVLYKGERTLCGTPEDLPCINPTGSAALATAGSGDVLSGIIAALACTIAPYEAAVCGAFIHGRAGESWSTESGADRGLLAHEIADAVPQIMGRILA